MSHAPASNCSHLSYEAPLEKGSIVLEEIERINQRSFEQTVLVLSRIEEGQSPEEIGLAEKERIRVPKSEVAALVEAKRRFAKGEAA